MILVLPEPKLYFCDPDEECFFKWLQAIPKVLSVTGTQRGIEVEFEFPIDRVSFYELVGLLTRYSLDTKVLRVLCDGHEDPWFNDPKNYWHSSVFNNT